MATTENKRTRNHPARYPGSDPILSGFEASEIFLVYNFPESNLVPEKYFSSDMTQTGNRPDLWRPEQ